MHQMDGQQPLKQADIIWEGLRLCMALKELFCSGNDPLPQHWSVLRAIHTLNTPKNYIHLLAKSSPIKQRCWSIAQGLMWSTRGLFPLAAAMVGYGHVGGCWPLEANVRLTISRNSKNCLRNKFFSYLKPIYSWHLTQQLKKGDLDLHTWNISCFLCPSLVW